MAAERRMDLVTGKTFTSSGSASAHSNSHMMPYSQSYADSNNNVVKQAKPRTTSSWSFSDPELKRRKRVASYKVYTVEGRVKSSFRKSIRWLKNKYLDIRYGWC